MRSESREARHLRIIMRMTDVLSIVVPAALIVFAVYWYTRRYYWWVVFNLGLATFNIGFTVFMQRRIVRLREKAQAELRVLERLMREHSDR